MAHCCVIGGGGFIGSYLAGLLLQTGRKVSVVGRSRTPSRPLAPGVCYWSHDYDTDDFLHAALPTIDEAILLAYKTVPKTSFDNPVQDIQDNLPPTVRFLEAASACGLRKVVLVSSGGTVYGLAQRLPIREDHPTSPISPYGITKLAIEAYGKMFYHLHGLPVVIVRPANAFGPGQRPFGGQGFVATALASILRGESVPIYGNPGTIRDYIYVGDVAEGIVAALERARPGACYNIGSGQGRSNLEVVEAIGNVVRPLGIEPQVVSLPRRPFDVPANVLDSSRLTRHTGWRARVSFEEGIEHCLRAGLPSKEAA